MASRPKTLLKAVLLVAASTGLSGCVYDVGLGFASDGYYDDGYGCDPFSGYDDYYACDYGQGFGNIGFGGGWYDNFYYPGYGIFLFDNIGRRYPMRGQYRRYWGEKRHNWYREHRGRDREGSRYQRRGNGYDDAITRGSVRQPDRRGARGDDRGDQAIDGRREGRGRGDRPSSRDGRGAVPMPSSDGLDRASRNWDRGAGAPRAGWPDAANRSERAPGSPTRENTANDVKPTEPRSAPQPSTRPRDRVSEGGVERPD